MKCPYCGQEMKLGQLRSESDRAVFWFPDHIKYRQWILTKKRIEEYGGVVLDTVSKIGFFATEKAESYWCERCNICITRK